MKNTKLKVTIFYTVFIVFCGYSQDSISNQQAFANQAPIKTSGLLIEINQQPISILSQSKYNILVNGMPYYFAKKSYFHFLTAFRLYDNQNRKQALAVKNHYYRWMNRYKIVRSDNTEIEWETVELIKRHHRCVVNNDTYDIYGHKERKFSIYKNNVQIAWWDKNMVSFFAGDQYKIIANSDCDKELITTFCLIIDQFKDDNKKGELNLDIGNLILPEARPFNPAWQPK